MYSIYFRERVRNSDTTKTLISGLSISASDAERLATEFADEVNAMARDLDPQFIGTDDDKFVVWAERD